ncbi:MAG: hypothetical protein FE834_08250, partial [Gammaproteobacteria bacterium]|nr:hypothetical protein [Gammaproteobacteria bacterium]
ADYVGITSANVTATVTDDDIKGVSNSETEVTLGETSTATYTIKLNTQPTGNVTITPASNDMGAATVSGAMIFTTTNWNTAQTVTVTGVNDSDSNNESVTISHTITGADYVGITSANVTATVTDDGIGIENKILDIDENSPIDTEVGVLTTTGNPDTYSIINGNTDNAFKINNSGKIQVNANVLDYEAVPLYRLTVKISQEGSDDKTAMITINVVDVKEDATFQVTLNYQRIIDENSPFASSPPKTNNGDLPIGILTYSLEGVDKDEFTVNPVTGVVSMIAHDHENPQDENKDNLYRTTLKATDSDDNATTVDINVLVTNVLENTIALDDQKMNVVKGSSADTPVGTVVLNSGTVKTWSITGGVDQGKYKIDDSGLIKVKITLADTVATHTIIVQAEGKDAASVTATISINNINRNTLAIANQNLSVNENSAAGTNVGDVLETTGNPTGFNITSGNTNGAFAINATGQITVADASKIDFEDAPSQTITVTINKDGANSKTATATITIAINNINENTLTIANQDLSVNENSATGTKVGDDVLVTTGSPDFFSIIKGNANAIFAINNSGQITVANANLDYETAPLDKKYTLTVQIRKDDADDKQAKITIEIKNVSENTILIKNDQKMNVLKDSGVNTPVGTVALSSGSVVVSTWSIIGGANASSYKIDDSGLIKVKTTLIGTVITTKHTIIVQAEGEDADPVTATITITIIGKTPLTIADQTRNVNENSAVGASVGPVLETTGNPNGFSITSGNGAGLFKINNAGQIQVAVANLDYEATPKYTLTVKIEQTGVDDKTAEITINVVDVKEDATFQVTLNYQRIIDENSPSASSPPKTNNGDLPIGILTYSLEGVDKDEFTVNPVTGVVSMLAHDHENPQDENKDNLYRTTLKATDSDDNAATVDINVLVKNVKEDSNFEIHDVNGSSIKENTIFVSTPPRFSGQDPIGTLTYHLGGEDKDDFTIDPDTGVVSSMIAHDHENPQDEDKDNKYKVTVTAIDSDDNSSSTRAMTVDVMNILENSISVSDNQSFETMDYLPVDTVIGELGATVIGSASDAITYTITRGNFHDVFKIDNDGKIKVRTTELDHTDINVYHLRIKLSVKDAEEKVLDEIEIKVIKRTTDEKMVVGGISYDAVAMGSQIWTSENMRHTSTVGSTWSYNNNPANDANGYGKLYDWNAATHRVSSNGWGAGDANEVQGICAEGWHVPNTANLDVLQSYTKGLGKTLITSDFKANLAGYRSNTYYRRGEWAYLWTSNGANTKTAYFRMYSGETVNTYTKDKSVGFSVRCLKN